MTPTGFQRKKKKLSINELRKTQGYPLCAQILKNGEITRRNINRKTAKNLNLHSRKKGKQNNTHTYVHFRTIMHTLGKQCEAMVQSVRGMSVYFLMNQENRSLRLVEKRMKNRNTYLGILFLTIRWRKHLSHLLVTFVFAKF